MFAVINICFRLEKDPLFFCCGVVCGWNLSKQPELTLDISIISCMVYFYQPSLYKHNIVSLSTCSPSIFFVNISASLHFSSPNHLFLLWRPLSFITFPDWWLTFPLPLFQLLWGHHLVQGCHEWGRRACRGGGACVVWTAAWHCGPNRASGGCLW